MIPSRLHIKFAILIGALTLTGHQSALAVDVFGVKLFDTGTVTPEGTIAYATALHIDEGEEHAGLQVEMRASSLLATQEKDGAADIFALASRARADHERLIAALYAEARYGATIAIRIAGQPLEELRHDSIEVTPGQAVAVDIDIHPGPSFQFGQITFDAAHSTEVAPDLTPSHYGLKSGDAARSTKIISAIDKLREAWRDHGYPLAQVVRKDISADHARSAVDLHVTIDPGPPAVYGWVNVTGASSLSTGTIADQSALEPGKRYDARDINKARDRLRKLESIESVRVVEGSQVDASGGIPMTLEVTERKPRYFGATASMSSLDGAELRAYWGHRNLFGEGERLRIDGAVSQLGEGSIEDSNFNVGAEFTKPGIIDVDTDLFTEFRIEREQPDTYESRFVKGRVGLVRRFSQQLSGTVAVEARYEQIDDVFGSSEYFPLSLTGELDYDTRDHKLDPTSGMHTTVLMRPTVDTLVETAYVSATASIATYAALNGNENIIFAGRFFGGLIAGSSLSDVPASDRFFAGGGSSVRGYEYRSLGPRIDGEIAGGLALIGGSAEARIRINDRFGIVPFIDAAAVSEDSAMSFSDGIYVGAGIGLRYYTSLGPLRLDVAIPLNDHPGQAGFGIYLGLGQAF